MLNNYNFHLNYFRDAEIKIEDIKPEYDIIDDFEYKPFFSNDVNNDEIYNAFWNSDVNSQNSEALIQSTEVLEPEVSQPI